MITEIQPAQLERLKAEKIIPSEETKEKKTEKPELVNFEEESQKK